MSTSPLYRALLDAGDSRFNACVGLRERRDRAGFAGHEGESFLTLPESASGRPAGQGPEVAQLLLASGRNGPSEFQSDSSPSGHAANDPVVYSVPTTSFGDFLEKRPRGRAARHPWYSLFDPDDESAPRL
jgi:hypothetical protein